MKSIVVGITGQTGAGKTTVTDYLRNKELLIINADEVSHYVTSSVKPCLMDLVFAFGIAILNVNGTVDRKKLGQIVFSEPQKLEQLNKVVFPYIKQELEKRIAAYRAKGENIIFLDAPTLFESGMDKSCDVVVVVVAPREQRMARIMERDRLTVEEAENRIASQPGEDFYTTRAWHVISNDLDKASLDDKSFAMMKAIAKYYRTT